MYPLKFSRDLFKWTCAPMIQDGLDEFAIQALLPDVSSVTIVVPKLYRLTADATRHGGVCVYGGRLPLTVTGAHRASSWAAARRAR
jgi:hypothetical protein